MDVFIDKFLTIMLCIFIFINSYIYKKFVIGTWLSPASIFSLVTFFYVAVPCLALIDVPIVPYGVLYIFLCVILFSAPAYFFNWQTAFHLNTRKILYQHSPFQTPFLMRATCACQIFVIFSICYNLKNNLSISNFFDFYTVFNQYKTLGYNHQIKTSYIYSLGVGLSHVGPTLGGMIIVGSQDLMKKIYIFILSLLPSFAFVLFFGSKGHIFLTLALFYAGVLIARIYNNNYCLMSKKTIKISLVLLIIFIVPGIILGFLQKNLHGASFNSIFLDKLLFLFDSYAFGHIYAFSDWFSSYFLSENTQQIYNQIPHTMGLYTFRPLYLHFVENVKIHPGMYSNFFFQKNIFITNLYTMYRGILLDYGFFGSLYFIFILGFAFHYCFYSLLINIYSPIFISFFCLFFGMCYLSYIASIFAFGDSFTYFVCLIFFLKANQFFFKKKEV